MIRNNYISWNTNLMNLFIGRHMAFTLRTLLVTLHRLVHMLSGWPNLLRCTYHQRSSIPIEEAISMHLLAAEGNVFLWWMPSYLIIHKNPENKLYVMVRGFAIHYWQTHFYPFVWFKCWNKRVNTSTYIIGFISSGLRNNEGCESTVVYQQDLNPQIHIHYLHLIHTFHTCLGAEWIKGADVIISHHQLSYIWKVIVSKHHLYTEAYMHFNEKKYLTEITPGYKLTMNNPKTYFTWVHYQIA